MIDNGRVVITGGVGFLGSHMCRALLRQGHDVLAVDNLCTGTLDNIADLLDQSRFSLVEQDPSKSLPNSLSRSRALTT